MRPVGQPAGGLFDASAQTSRHTSFERRPPGILPFVHFFSSSGFRVGSVIDLGAAPGRAPAPLDAFCACTKGRDAVRFVLIADAMRATVAGGSFQPRPSGFNCGRCARC